MAATTEDLIRAASVQLKEAIDRRTQELLDQLQSSTSSNNTTFSFDKTLLSSCSSFGQLYTCSTNDQQLCPSNCHVSGTGTQFSTVDEASYITVHLLTESHKEYHQDDECEHVPVEVKLMNIHNELICKGERVRTCNNEVTFRYVPTERGQHMLEVTVLGQPVKRSPFNVNIKMPFKFKCIVQKTLTSFSKPGGLAVGPGGELAVVDTKGWNTIHVYNTNHDLVMSTGPWGTYEGQSWEPIGVTFDLSGNLLVVDGGNMRIHKFDRQGKHVMTVGKKGKEKLEFLRPTGIAVSSTGNVYICDRTNNRIQVLKPNLTFDFTFGSYGTGPRDLYNPWDVALDSEGFIYVVDAGHRCIKKFTPFGVFECKIGPETTGVKEDEPKCLEMLCIDECDYIYVTDRDANCVFVFDTSGRFHTKFGCYGYSEGQFYAPRGIAKVNGKLYISEVGNRRVQLFG